MTNRHRLLLFVAVFVLVYGLTRIGSFQSWFIERLTVPLAAWVLAGTGHEVSAAGPRLVAEGGGLNVLQGCEGLDLLALWIAAVCAGPFSWRRRLAALTLGTLIVFGFNQLRLFSLFHLYRSHRDWFGDAHGLWWPLALVALVWALYALWQRRSGPVAA